MKKNQIHFKKTCRQSEFRNKTDAAKSKLSKTLPRPYAQFWWVVGKSGNQATWRKGVSFSFGALKPRCQVSVLVLRLLKNRFQFRFQFCLRTASVSGFQFRFKFHPRKLFYFEYGLCKCSTSWRFCFITMISSSSDTE